MQQYRIDFQPLAFRRSEVTPEGYLRCDATVARTGIQEYTDDEGKIRKEYRPESEVANTDSLATFGGKVVTKDHPANLVTAENTKELGVGFSDSTVLYDKGFVKVAVTLTDPDIVKQCRSGKEIQVSAGYKVDLDEIPGYTPDGQYYDAIQRNIRVNHIALVDRGRAGPEVKLHLDSETCLCVQHKGDQMETIMIGESEIEVAPEVADYIRQIEEQLLDSSEQQVSEAVNTEEDPAMDMDPESEVMDPDAESVELDPEEDPEEDPELMMDSADSKSARPRKDGRPGYELMKDAYSMLKKQTKDMEKRLNDTMAQLDAMRKQYDTLKAKSKTDRQDQMGRLMDGRVQERVALIDKARLILGSDYKFDTLTNNDIRIAAIAELDPDWSATDCSPTYVEGRFDALTSGPIRDVLSHHQSSTGLLRDALGRVVNDSAGLGGPIQAPPVQQMSKFAITK